MTPPQPPGALSTTKERRDFLARAPVAWLGASMLPACSAALGDGRYAELAAQVRRPNTWPGIGGLALSRELVRLATLAPSSHNTQCWRFTAVDKGITLMPDLARRCPAVDPDDHHVFVSLGCATENLSHAALAHGLHAEARFDAWSDVIRVALSPTPALDSALYRAIPARQCTRSDYDGKPLSNAELALLEQSGTSSAVRVLLLTERQSMEQALAFVVSGNTSQMADPAFVRELKSWIRFNGEEAVRLRDGLFSGSSGSRELPTWLGDLALGWFFNARSENDRIARQVRSSAGFAVFVGGAADKAHWVEVGRAYERFALQATVLGVRTAFLNQPVEESALRSPFAAALGLAGQRPDLVVRFGRGPMLPSSLRRSVESVMA